METYEFNQWAEFRSWIDEHCEVTPVYWRGQKDPSWPLASSFERIILKLCGGWMKGAAQIYPYDHRYERDGQKIWTKDYYQMMRDRYLEAFKAAAAGLRGPNPASLKPEEWWALGRHFSLVTPLLDWTESPYIAAFFPLSELFAEKYRSGGGITFHGEKVAVYRLFDNGQLQGDGLKVVHPVMDELIRMHGQRGLFTWLDSEKYFEIQGFLEDTGRGNLLTKLIISDHALFDGLRDLRDHGIDYRLLFPDLTGAAMSVNAKFEQAPFLLATGLAGQSGHLIAVFTPENAVIES